MKGYKAFNYDWTCNGFQYEVGKTYKHDGPIELCKSGFHFCENPADCWDYYVWDGTQKFAEIEATGEIETDGIKSVTNEITIIAEIPTGTMLKICNVGVSNYGVCNTGDCNIGSHNAGDYNTGHYNAGHYNAGHYNAGSHNTGDHNIGSHNAGHYNAGDYNTGHYNAGSHNTGDHNTGSHNTGDHNTGNYNVGDFNTGYRNTGHCNVGDYNTGNHSCGCFCEDANPKIKMFDMPSSWTMQDWLDSDQARILSRSKPPAVWIDSGAMTDEEKTEHHEYETTGGYLKKYTPEEITQNNQKWWDGLSETDRDCIKELPNFDAEKFCRIMGDIKI